MSAQLFKSASSLELTKVTIGRFYELDVGNYGPLLATYGGSKGPYLICLNNPHHTWENSAELLKINSLRELPDGTKVLVTSEDLGS